ncbi:ABC transporter ATP-binding protein [Thermovenabulum gondwanense]|uniref:Galactose/methyl galactoside import ATP-binding protein MglA n=1 Tax=Thermovenabulum gondwanense TaxID=520767 RepID=A0A162MKM4_9FIRM|nr:ABC transporter ATP-binding protein [Thermovenabulum gondwanense]KYO66497.1 Galactose/methyl galactoside import ATP-binding protein MglA [Thermovenabulum gondwanense]
MEKAIVLKNITKRFPGIVANDRINLEVDKGEIHAIVGENGAGKSTLMKILSGLYQPDEGEIFIFGKKERISSPNRAIELKIGMVHQHFMLVGRFSVLENIILGAERKKGLTIDWEESRKAIENLCRLYNFSVDLKARVEDISVGMAQRVEILKVLYRGADILVLDEPTAVLAPQEVKELFVNLRRLKEEGKTIIFISHKLDEVLEIADKITVLRRGKVVGTVEPQKVNKEELAKMMVGKPVLLKLDREEVEKGEVVVSLENLRVKDRDGRPVVEGVNIKIRAGEIYGIAGVEGNGQKELAETIIGLRRADGGDIKVLGKSVKDLSIRERRDLGIAFIPEDRHKQGLVLPMKVWENAVLGLHRKKDFYRAPSLDVKNAERFCRTVVEEYHVSLSSIRQAVEGLSGGNQQKVILGRELSQNPVFIIAAQPTRGLDIGASEFVYSQLLKLRKEGKAILLISADLDEVLSLSDRVGVMYGGKIVAEFEPQEVSLEEIGLYMLGAHEKAGEAS